MKPNKSLWLSILALGLIVLGTVAAWNLDSVTKVGIDSNDSQEGSASSSQVTDSSGTAASSLAQPSSGSASPDGSTAGTPVIAMDRPLSQVGGQNVDYPGPFTKATVQAEGNSYQLTPNQLGNFQRVNVGPKAKVQVQISYPQGEAGDAVAVEVEDGGHLNQDQMSEVATLDDQKTVQFQFQTTDQNGIYRVALRNGSDVKVLNFWVGPELQVREQGETNE